MPSLPELILPQLGHARGNLAGDRAREACDWLQRRQRVDQMLRAALRAPIVLRGPLEVSDERVEGVARVLGDLDLIVGKNPGAPKSR